MMAEPGTGCVAIRVAPTVEQALAPIGLAAFIERYWKQDVLHLPGAPARFAGVLDWEGLSRLFEVAALQPPRVRLVRGGKRIPAEAYFRAKGDLRRLDPSKLSLELERGATLVISWADELVPTLAALSDEIARTFDVRSNANLYASWTQENGLPLHWDHHGVLVLQLAGRKRWTVYAPVRADPLEGDSFEAPPEGAKPVFDGLIEDGDVLYLPRGFPHVAHAVDGPSLHATMALTETTGIGFVGWLSDLLREDARLRAGVPRPGDAAEDARWLAEVRELVLSAMTPHALSSYRALRASDKPARPRFAFPDLGHLKPEAWTGATRVSLASDRGVSMSYGPDGHMAIALMGREWLCSEPVARAILALAGSSVMTIETLEGGLAENDRAELRRILELMLVGGKLHAYEP